MNKIRVAIIWILLLLLCLSACVSTRGPLPYGKWESVEPHIIMDINQQEYEANGIFSGTYFNNEAEEISVFFTFAVHSKELSIYNLSDKLEALLNGRYTFTENNLNYKLKPYWQEKSGITDTIVFTKIEEYEAPDPKDDPN